MSHLQQDLRYSLRQLRRNPGFSLIVLTTLALGIGSSTAIYSFVHGVLMRPLPYPDSERLVLVCESHPDHPGDWCGGSPANLWDWRRESKTLETVGLARSWGFGLKDDAGRFRNVRGGVATVGTFDALRARPVMGRIFERRDHDPGGDHVVVLGHRLWQRRFGGDEAVVGRTVNLDEESYAVIGVLPADFEVPYLEQVELWIPLWSDRVDWRSWRGLRPYGRLAPGATLAQARAEMETLAANLAAQHPETNAEWGLKVDRLHDRMVASVRPALVVFLGAVGFVLLVACANVANLLLTRATRGEREFAIRTALGAGRARMLRALLTDSLVLSLLGGAAGVLLAFWLIRLFVSFAPAGFPRIEQVRLDGGVLLFALLLSVATSLLFGLLPAWRSTRVDLNSALTERRHGGASGATNRARSALVVAEVGLALVLLIGAGLLMRSFINLTDWAPGFDTEQIVAFSVFPPLGKYQQREQLSGLYRQINAELTALPGVVSAGEVSAGPLFGGGDGLQEFSIEGRPRPAQGEFPTVAWFDCGPSYFSTIGIPLRRGRFFTAADGAAAPRVAIINETMARRHWPDADPVGQRVHLKVNEVTVEIVGVVGDVPPFDPRQSVAAEIYWPLEQGMRGATFYAVRTAIEPSSVIASIRESLDRVEPELGTSAVTTLEERIGNRLVEPRFHVLLLGLFSAIAFVIAMVGIYGVVSYSVAQRTHEFGIRLALGARPWQMLVMVLRGGLLLALIGVALGSIGALTLTELLESLLVEISPTDAGTFVAVSLAIVLVSLLACWVPAWRATRVDPMRALREE